MSTGAWPNRMLPNIILSPLREQTNHYTNLTQPAHNGKKPWKSEFQHSITKVSPGKIFKISETALSLCSSKTRQCLCLSNLICSPPPPQKEHKNHGVKLINDIINTIFPMSFNTYPYQLVITRLYFNQPPLIAFINISDAFLASSLSMICLRWNSLYWLIYTAFLLSHCFQTFGYAFQHLQFAFAENLWHFQEEASSGISGSVDSITTCQTDWIASCRFSGSDCLRITASTSAFTIRRTTHTSLCIVSIIRIPDRANVSVLSAQNPTCPAIIRPCKYWYRGI